jgi:hypothetical protein
MDMPKDFMPEAGIAANLPELTDGPGRYRVSGVDRESKMDTSLVLRADSAANAKVKAELEGVIVTAVEFVGRF